MKTAKPPAAEAPSGPPGSNRRAQPVRQTRINPTRTSSLNRTNSFPNGPAPEQPIDVFPAVTHFADAITALPKELVRHFTLLKEVDAKIFAPEATLFELVDAALKAPVPDRTRSITDGNSSVAPASTPMSAQNSTSGLAAASANPATVPPSITDSAHAAVFDPTNLPRRHLFRQAAWKIQEMLVSLEEKNHVISTANDALNKQLSRIEEIWPHLENEFSDEAKWGSTAHWAYAENRVPKTNHKEAERSRREGAATLSAAAQQIAEEAAARSSDRKQALAAKKNNKGQATEPEADSKAQETTKKGPGTGKSRKHQAEATPVGLGIANGTPTNGAGPSKRRKVEKEPKTNGGAPMERAMSSVFGNGTAKTKTTTPRESPAPDGAATTGPTTKKRKALPSGSGQAKKSRTNAANSPSVAASPLLGSLPDTKAGRNSPVPLPPRPASSRARQNSTASTNLPIQQRPATAATNKPNGITPAVVEAVAQSKSTLDAKAQKEAEPAVSTPAKTEAAKPETEIKPPVPPEPVSNAGTAKKENSKAAIAPAKEPEAKKRSNSIVTQTAILPPPISTTVTTTKSGRASKPSTPALGTFAEAANATTTTARSRPSRNNTNQSDKDSNGTSGKDTSGNSTTTTSGTTTSKRSHKKGASSVSAMVVPAALQDEKPGKSAAASDEKKDASDENNGRPTTSGRGKGGAAHRDSKAERALERDRGGDRDAKSETGHGHGHGRRGTAAAAAAARAQQQQPQHQQRQEEEEEDDDDEVDADEQRYCFCNGVSYGEMVACDGEGCPREWFHLECVGLKVAPKGNAKWYCEDCKKRLRASGR
ncbi:hypothetical protein B0H65DRAFT_183947 [Neurospora tetraspora]|uniref:Chromatin modification-related protein n=1 Tax=Neurospora tetraspora TaxID=94610 RepID=A0AAE0JE82_9PEZI|nr:hypothetical protein B0H65DRAFT_183947 [Neurospora tetraspora]